MNCPPGVGEVGGRVGGAADAAVAEGAEAAAEALPPPVFRDTAHKMPVDVEDGVLAALGHVELGGAVAALAGEERVGADGAAGVAHRQPDPLREEVEERRAAAVGLVVGMN